jgi:hypothetical protein
MRLITFGDSWTAGHGVETDVKYKEDSKPPVFIDKLRMMNSWPRWVADKFNCEYVNLGVCGYGNEYIYNDIKSTIDNNFIEKGDIIIVMLSYPYRYKKNNHNVIEIFNKMEESMVGYEHFYFNSFYPTFKNENMDTNTLPKCFINPNGCVSDILREYEIENNVGVWEYNSRSVWNDEKNFWEGDYHPNLLGYKIIADYVNKSILDGRK